MIWRRVLVSETTTLRELHGILQVAMGWEGIHLFAFSLHAAEYESPELGGKSPDIALGMLQMRKGQRFAYEYNFNIPWEHEVRLETRNDPKLGKTYPYCVGGNAMCPSEDCGGIEDHLTRRDALYSVECFEDMDQLSEFIDNVVLKERRDLLKKEELVVNIKEILERINAFHDWQGVPFDRKAINIRLKQGDHLDLMY